MSDKLKNFDLDKALSGDEVVDKMGRSYSQFKNFNVKDGLRSLVCVDEAGEFCYFYPNGQLKTGEPYLFIKPKTKKLWIAISKCENRPHGRVASNSFFKLEDLKNMFPEHVFHHVEVEIEE